MDGLDEALREFLAECDENLDQLDRDLLAAELIPPDRAMLDRTFRAVHTIKGTCGFFALSHLSRVAHAGENLLGAVRDGHRGWSTEVSAALLGLTAALRSILRSVADGNGEGDESHDALIADLGMLREATPRAPVPDATGPPECPENPRAVEPGGLGANVRVDVGLLDTLMNLVGELVLARNQILQRDGGGPRASQRLDQITIALQEGVMKARMQPIGQVWGKLPRMVRDLAAACGKQVRLETSGDQTELDRTIIEAVRDPLTHLLRNALDHGIEPPEQRVAAGKPETGTLRLRAHHENGQVVMELADDGAGVDTAKVARHAVDLGLISSEQAARMTDRDLTRLIFLPGFTTAERVTSVSGRGVGMDVVRTNIAAIGGAVDVRSVTGVGTTIRVNIPLTLAIIPALIVEAGGDHYAIPRANILELVGLGPGEALEKVHETPVHRLRGRLLPLVDLAEMLGVEPVAGLGSKGRIILVLQADERTFGLVVESVLDGQEIVVKPIGRLLAGLPFYSGSAILGDGRVALILDARGLAREARIEAIEPAADASARRDARLRPFLIVRAGTTGQLAVPLEQVSRLEKIPAAAVEFADGREVAQYRGEILPLLRVPGAAAVGPDGLLRVVIHETREGPVGFVVDAILDVVEDVGEARRATRGRGLAGSTVLGGQVTDLIDLPSLLSSPSPETSAALNGKEG